MTTGDIISDLVTPRIGRFSKTCTHALRWLIIFFPWVYPWNSGNVGNTSIFYLRIVRSADLIGILQPFWQGASLVFATQNPFPEAHVLPFRLQMIKICSFPSGTNLFSVMFAICSGWLWNAPGRNHHDLTRNITNATKVPQEICQFQGHWICQLTRKVPPNMSSVEPNKTCQNKTHVWRWIRPKHIYRDLPRTWRAIVRNFAISAWRSCCWSSCRRNGSKSIGEGDAALHSTAQWMWGLWDDVVLGKNGKVRFPSRLEIHWLNSMIDVSHLDIVDSHCIICLIWTLFGGYKHLDTRQ